VRDATLEEYAQLIEALNELRRGRQRLPLTLDQIAQLARRAKILEAQQGQTILRQGDRPDYLYFVVSGQLRAIDTTSHPPRLLNYLPMSSFFGEHGMLTGRRRYTTVDTVLDAKLAGWDWPAFDWATQTYPQLRAFLARNYERWRRGANWAFPGKQWDEVIVTQNGKHIALLVQSQLMPLLILLASIIVFIATKILWPFLFLLVIAVVWAAVAYVEWRNDQYIVTSKRAIHIERFVFSGEVWHEAPLIRIQDVTLQTTNALERLLDFQTMTIRTAGAADIRFVGVPNADIMQEILFEARAKAQERKEAADLAGIRRKIAGVVGTDLPEGELPVTEPLASPGAAFPGRQTRLPALINFFVPRTMEIEGDKITWRKHWLVILGKTLKWWLLVIVLVLAAIILPTISKDLHFFVFAIVGIPFILPIILWHYADWRNDVYIVTDRRIIDLERGPLRLYEMRREGTFDAVQNITYAIPTFFHKLVNMGNVTIETAGTEETFTFKSVHRPGSVQQEIFNRWVARRDEMDRESKEAQASQMAAWIAEYHRLQHTASPPQKQ
jgi:hypothetical protein